MAEYFMASYDIQDPEGFTRYNPGGIDVLRRTVEKHHGKIQTAGPGTHWYAGERYVVVVIEFPDIESARAWEADEETASQQPFRLASSVNRFKSGFEPA